MAHVYDVIFDGIQHDEQRAAFCSAKAHQYRLGEKNCVAAICRHIEDNLLLQVLESCKDRLVSGNTGMTHLCLAVNSIALDRPGAPANGGEREPRPSCVHSLRAGQRPFAP